MLIVVPLSLRRDIFSAYHATPSAGHVGIYKTLHRINLRFFWPHSRKVVTDWCLKCPHCLTTNGSVSRNSELIFSWPLCCPLYILHVDLWQPGAIENYHGETYLMNVMCDLNHYHACSRILFVHHLISKCTTACGSLLHSSLTIHLCSNSPMFPTLTLLLWSHLLTFVFPSLPSQLTLLSQFMSMTTRLSLSLR